MICISAKTVKMKQLAVFMRSSWANPHGCDLKHRAEASRCDHWIKDYQQTRETADYAFVLLCPLETDRWYRCSMQVVLASVQMAVSEGFCCFLKGRIIKSHFEESGEKGLQRKEMWSPTIKSSDGVEFTLSKPLITIKKYINIYFNIYFIYNYRFKKSWLHFSF